MNGKSELVMKDESHSNLFQRTRLATSALAQVRCSSAVDSVEALLRRAELLETNRTPIHSFSDVYALVGFYRNNAFFAVVDQFRLFRTNISLMT